MLLWPLICAHSRVPHLPPADPPWLSFTVACRPTMKSSRTTRRLEVTAVVVISSPQSKTRVRTREERLEISPNWLMNTKCANCSGRLLVVIPLDRKDFLRSCAPRPSRAPIQVRHASPRAYPHRCRRGRGRSRLIPCHARGWPPRSILVVEGDPQHEPSWGLPVPPLLHS